LPVPSTFHNTKKKTKPTRRDGTPNVNTILSIFVFQINGKKKKNPNGWYSKDYFSTIFFDVFKKTIWYNFGEMCFPSVNSTDFAIFCRTNLSNLQ
jgi:hypothetical protein